MDSFSFFIPGSAALEVTVTEQADGSLRFDLANRGDLVADLRGLFFDVNDSDILSGLTISGTQVSRVAAGDDAISNLGNGVNMNGVGSFDVGIAFGSAGIGKDDIRATTFSLSSSSGPLDLEDLAGVDFGVRFTSVGQADGSRDGSLKLFAQAPELGGETPVDWPPVDLPPIWPPFDLPPAG